MYKFGSYALRASGDAEAKKLKEDALMLQELGCFILVTEKIPAALASEVTAMLDIPTIGIGAGNGTDGQVLVLQDMLGLNRGFKPKFLRLYDHLGDQIIDSVGNYINDVKSGDFPNEQEQY